MWGVVSLVTGAPVGSPQYQANVPFALCAQMTASARRLERVASNVALQGGASVTKCMKRHTNLILKSWRMR